MPDAHPHEPEASFEGGDLDCGNGLLLLIRRHIDPLRPGQFLEILSTESSVEEDLPAWCRLTGNELVSRIQRGDRRSYLVSKGAYVRSPATEARVSPRPREPVPVTRPVVAVSIPESLPAPAAAPPVPPWR